jgi:hypothetical protein
MTESRKNQFIVTDKNGNPYGPFNDATEAARWAAKKWPDQEQDSDRTGKGWDITMRRSPNE